MSSCARKLAADVGKLPAAGSLHAFVSFCLREIEVI